MRDLNQYATGVLLGASIGVALGIAFTLGVMLLARLAAL